MSDLKQYQPSAEQLEVGKVYEFSNTASNWAVDVLLAVDGHTKSPYESGYDYWSYIRECQAPLGKIKPKPVELVDGEPYMFDCGEHQDQMAIYIKDDLSFWSNGRQCLATSCTNIRRLKVVDDE